MKHHSQLPEEKKLLLWLVDLELLVLGGLDPHWGKLWWMQWSKHRMENARIGRGREQGSQSHDEHSPSDLNSSTGPSSDVRLCFPHMDLCGHYPHPSPNSKPLFDCCCSVFGSPAWESLLRPVCVMRTSMKTWKEILGEHLRFSDKECSTSLKQKTTEILKIPNS